MYQAKIITDNEEIITNNPGEPKIEKSLDEILYDGQERPIAVQACTTSGKPFRDFEFWDEWQKQPALIIYPNRKEVWKCA